MIDFYSAVILVAGIAFVHTVSGPDHYLTFWSMAKSHSWTARRTFLFVFLCGLSHVAASLVIALPAVFLGEQLLGALEIQHARGRLVGWLLIAIGLFYLYRAFKSQMLSAKALVRGTPLFFVFLLGPCEPIIALLMAQQAVGAGHMATLIAAYTISTVATMCGCVLILMIAEKWAASFGGTGNRLVPALHFPLTVHHKTHLMSGVLFGGCGVAMLALGV